LGHKDLAKFTNRYGRQSCDDFLRALRLFREKQKTNPNFNNVVGYEKEKSELLKVCKTSKEHSKVLKINNLETAVGILLYGPPGCGKSFLIKSLAKELDKYFLELTPARMARNSTPLLEFAKELTDTVIFFDEIDSISKKREYSNTSILTSEILARLGSESIKKDSIVVGATNFAWEIDPALVRSGRLGKMIYVGLPDSQTRIQLIYRYTQNCKKEKIDINKISKTIENYSCSDIELLCKEAVLNMLREGRVDELLECDFEYALENVFPTAISWFEEAKNISFPQWTEKRLKPMIDDIKRYKSDQEEMKHVR
jgi:SpoVK/Ycf46/Vps4 family AAA+-type ATPase